MNFLEIVEIVKGFKKNLCQNETLMLFTNDVGTGFNNNGSREWKSIYIRTLHRIISMPSSDQGVGVKSNLKEEIHSLVFESRTEEKNKRAKLLAEKILSKYPNYVVFVAVYPNRYIFGYQSLL